MCGSRAQVKYVPLPPGPDSSNSTAGYSGTRPWAALPSGFSSSSISGPRRLSLNFSPVPSRSTACPPWSLSRFSRHTRRW
jgi:hypothetical protein